MLFLRVLLFTLKMPQYLLKGGIYIFCCCCCWRPSECRASIFRYTARWKSLASRKTGAPKCCSAPTKRRKGSIRITRGARRQWPPAVSTEPVDDGVCCVYIEGKRLVADPPKNGNNKRRSTNAQHAAAPLAGSSSMAGNHLKIGQRER